ncbi:response regulator [Methylorubrum sp. SB2]|uniref:response regulator n=1 Tax=Methylorubrum subtropicum TaxID=3138812 RepID=UPI00313B438E
MTADLVHVVDDDPAMRDSLAFLIGLGGFETRLYASGADLLARLPKPAMGCVLADLRMPGIDGLELLRRLRAAGQTLAVVMMTGHGEVPLAVEAMKLGARDFIEKPFEDAALLHTLRAALEHRPERWFPAFGKKTMRHKSLDGRPGSEIQDDRLERGGADLRDPALRDFLRRVGTLSERERQVLDHLIAGATSKTIGRALAISPRTVEIYRAKLMAKTRAGSLQELVRWAVLVGLV